MRILILDTYYPAFQETHYSARPGLESKPYETQLASLLGSCFGTSDAYSRAFRALGHEAVEVIANCEPLQGRWEAENAPRSRFTFLRRPRRESNPERIVIEQIAAYEPDVVQVQDISFFGAAELEELRSRGFFLAGQIASPAPPDEILRGFDLIATSFPHFVERFRALGVDARYLKLAFDSQVLERLREGGIDPSPGTDRRYPVSFVGGLDPAVHGAGVELLERLSRELPVEVWGYGAERLAPDSPLRERHRGEAWGLDMYRVLAGSRIVVNRHIDAAEGHANNMRLYEATGSGALLITEAADNLEEIFEPGREVVAYTNVEDLIEQVSHYIEHDDERQAIAAAGQRRTLAEHTYDVRVRELAGMLEGRLRSR